MKLRRILLVLIPAVALSILSQAASGQSDGSTKQKFGRILASLYVNEKDASCSDAISEAECSSFKCEDVTSLTGEGDQADWQIRRIVVEASEAFRMPIPEIAFIRGKPNAYAVSEADCPNYKGKKMILVGKSLLKLADLNSEEITDDNQLRTKYILVGILAHELAHLKQQELKSQLKGKEMELHADFLAGWYLQRHNNFAKTRMSLSVEKKKQGILAAFSTFFMKGDQNVNSVAHHGLPEDRLQIILSGLRASDKAMKEAYATGEKTIAENSIFWNADRKRD